MTTEKPELRRSLRVLLDPAYYLLGTPEQKPVGRTERSDVPAMSFVGLRLAKGMTTEKPELRRSLRVLLDPAYYLF